MKRYLLNSSLILVLVMLFAACENTNPLQRDSASNSFSSDQMTLLSAYDNKSCDSADGDIQVWQFWAAPDQSMEWEQGEIISMGMSEQSVDHPMMLSARLIITPNRPTFYEFGPHGTQFLQPILMATTLEFWDVPSDVNLEDLSYFYLNDNGTNNPQDDTYEVVPSYLEGGSLVGMFEHFSKYAVGVLPSRN